MDPTGFFTEGYIRMNNPEVFKPLEEIVSTITWVKSPEGMFIPKINRKIKEALKETHDLLAKTYIQQVFQRYELGYSSIWNGVDTLATRWHCDYTTEKPNAMFLLYLNDMSEETGGAFGYRNAVTKEETGFFYPKKYDVVFGSQQPSWEHKATKINNMADRITANFGFIIEGIQ